MTVFGNYAAYYDAFYKTKDYPAEVALIDDLIHTYTKGTPRSILDFGCGAGGHAVLLAERGYDVVGVDRSDQMLAIARKKAERLQKLNFFVDFTQGSICDIDLKRKFDIIISMFAVLSYQATNEDFESTLQNAAKHLHDDGLFIFDVWFGPAVISKKPRERILIIEDGSEKIMRLSQPSLDVIRQTVDVKYNVLKIKGDSICDYVTETHKMRFFFPRELHYCLKEAGFQVVKMAPFMDMEGTLSESTWNALVVAKKSNTHAVSRQH